MSTNCGTQLYIEVALQAVEHSFFSSKHFWIMCPVTGYLVHPPSWNVDPLPVVQIKTRTLFLKLRLSKSRRGEKGNKEESKSDSEWLQCRGSHEHDWWKLVTKRDKSLFRDIVGHELFIFDFIIYFILFSRTPAYVEKIGNIWGFFKNWKQKNTMKISSALFSRKVLK